MQDRSSPRSQAQDAFLEFIQLVKRGSAPERAEFVARQPDSVRDELTRILDDYDVLKRSAGQAVLSLDAERRVGDFRLVQEIGRGGMGSVWEAEQLSIGRRVAIKLLHPHLSLAAAALRRFRTEAEAGGRINHPSIVTVYEVGQDDGVHYIAQELVPGGFTLADLLADMRDRPELDRGWYRRVAQLLAAVADALEVAHRAGVLHRDVKPGNILLLPDGTPKLADFGLAKIQDELGMSRTGELTGTPFYMSPEQAASQGITPDARTDVFSLGATLYEALTLRRPFEGESSQRVIEKILLDDPVDPRRVHRGVPRDLSLVCLKALEKNRERRYVSAGGFAEDLRRWLRAEPILARSPSPIGRGVRWCRRHPVLAASGSIGAVALIALSTLLATNRAARRRAETAEREQARALALLGDALSLSDPDVRFGPAAARDRVLHDFVVSASQLFESDAARRVDWLSTAAGALLGSGAPAEAETLFAAAVESARKAYGPGNRRTIETMLARGVVLVDLDRFRDAAALLHEAWAEAKSALGGHDPLTRSTLRALVLTFIREENRDRIVELAGEIARITEDVEAEVGRLASEDVRDDRLIGPLRDLARLRSGAEDWIAAERLYAELAELCRAQRGPKHPDTLAARLGQLVCWNRTNRHREADSALRDLIRDATDVLGAVHPTTLRSRWRLAINHIDLGEHEAALPLYSALIPDMERVLGRRHLDTLKARTGYAILLFQLGPCDQLLPYATALYADFCDEIGPTHSSSTTCERVLAYAYRAQGDVERVEQTVRSAVQHAAAGPGEGSVYWIDATADLVWLYQQERRFSDAAALEHRRHECLRAQSVANESWIAGVERNLTHVKARTADCTTALRSLETLHEETRARFGEGSREEREVRLWTARTLIDCGDAEAALPILVERERIGRESHSRDWTASVLLGNALLDLGRLDEAEEAAKSIQDRFPHCEAQQEARKLLQRVAERTKH